MFTINLKKYINSLHQKKFRQKYNKFIVETPKLISELLLYDKYNIEHLCALNEWIDDHAALLHRKKITAIPVTPKQLSQISGLKNPNSVLAVVDKPTQKLEFELDKWALYLDSIQDPGNVGTMLRIADWFGIAQVIANVGSADFYNPKVIQASMGSIFRVELIKHTIVPVQESRAYQLYALDGGGQNIHDQTDLKPGLLVIGNEGKGVQDNILANADAILGIPRKGKAESLNAAIACGIACGILFK